MSPNTSQRSALTRLFSSTVFKELANKGRSPLFARLLKETGVTNSCGGNDTVGAAFDFAFSILKTVGFRDEYIYRAALTQKILLGTHSLRTASMLTEFRAGSCRADLVILNGTATAYEIKSERDSLTRLVNQIENYMNVFAAVNVIASEDHVESVCCSVPAEVGVLSLSSDYSIEEVRAVIDQPFRICPEIVFESLQTAEAAEILIALGREVRKVPNTQRREAMRASFSELPPVDVHEQMVKTLKRTRNLEPLSDLVGQLPESLRTAALSVPLKRGTYLNLINAVDTPLSVAMAWN